MLFRSNPIKKELTRAREWLQLADKVHHFRRDVLSATQLVELERARENLRELISGRDKPNTQAIQTLTEELEKVLQSCGGSFYPRRFWAEQAEMLLVAAILVIGVRTFFLQPFKIPTNSMYPTYNGMTYEIHEEAPGPLERLVRFAAFGAKFYTITAEDSGELLIPIQDGAGFAVEPVRGRKWFIIPTTLAQHTLFIGNVPVHVNLPPDFSFQKVILEQFGSPNSSTIRFIPGLGHVFKPGIRFQKGDTVLAFEVLSGDALFVDRMSYHFRRPQAGEPFVFRTESIPAIGTDKYYIKRLVGEPGDTLHIEEPVLMRNGAPADPEIADVFRRNAEREGRYRGYIARARLSEGRSVTVPKDHYFALGDNSPESSDSRDWGFVPMQEVIGKAVFIYYPFTRRWGISE